MPSDAEPFSSGPREEALWRAFCTKSLLNAARYGDVELVQQRLADGADAIVLEYLPERRKVAERIFDTRGNLERIVEMLEACHP